MVSILGLLSFLLTGLIAGLIDFYTGFSLYGFMLYAVFPGGAFACGVIAAGGYFYAAVIKYNQKPFGGIILNIVVSTLIGFLTAYYTPYYLMTIDGDRLKNIISFWAYLDFLIKHMSMESISYTKDILHTTDLSVTNGHVFTAIQLFGFAIGSIIIFIWMGKQPFCKNCSRYIRISINLERYTGDWDLFNEMINNFKKLIEERKYNDAIKYHEKEMGVYEETEYHYLRTKLKAGECVSCGISYIELIASIRERNSWNELHDAEVKMFLHTKLQKNI